MRSFLWITDPWSTLDHPKDTTLRLAEECLAQGIAASWCDVRTIRFEKGRVVLDARKFEAVFPGRAASSFTLGAPEARAPDEFTQLFYRTDPPVDASYLHPLQLLVLGLEGSRSARIVNPASVLFSANEKSATAGIVGLTPATEISSQKESLLRFLQSEGRAVLKPLHQAQSKGVELLDWNAGQERALELLETATESYSRPVLLQKYLEAIRDGETRLWFIDGRLLAFVRKLPVSGDFRVNMDQGSKLARAELSSADKKAAQKIGKFLRQRKIRLAAVDLIESLVTDVNFTSPGLITQMEGILGENLAKPIVEALAR